MESVPPPHLFRRLFHLASPVFLVYYWIPPDLAGGLARQGLLFLFLGSALCVEVARIALRIPVFGMRAYEAARFSAYAWGMIGLALGFLFFPWILVIPAFCGMAWIDPLAAWSRRTGRYPWLPAAGYAAAFAGILLVLGVLSVPEVAALTAIAVPVALLAEYPDIRVVDDDFLMTIAPLLVLTPALPLVQALL